MKEMEWTWQNFDSSHFYKKNSIKFCDLMIPVGKMRWETGHIVLPTSGI